MKSMPEILKPKAIQAGETIGIFTPSSPSNVKHREKYLHGIAVLKQMGFAVIEGSLTAKAVSQGYRSGTPVERTSEFMELIRNPEVKAMISTIGGANSSSMIPYLDFDEIRSNPKIICGYSDVTSLHLSILAYSGLSTFYGPAVMPTFGEWPDVLEETKNSFLDAVQRHTAGRRELHPPKRWSNHLRFAPGQWKSEPRIFQENPGWKVLNSGSATASLIIANLNTLMTSAGTTYFPSLEGKILLIEEMNASLSEEERDLRHLERLGVFDVISGLILSKPEVYDSEGAPFGYDDLLMETVGSHRTYPIISGFDCGHTNPTLTLAQMSMISLEAKLGMTAELTLLEPMTS